MSSILKVDTIQDQSGNNIINESGNVITIGAAGDTITVPAGATVSGFTSAGIDDNATSTAITINSSEQVGIGETNPDKQLEISSSTGGTLQLTNNSTSIGAGESLGEITFFSSDISGDGTGVRGFIKSVENDGGTGRRYDLTFGTGNRAAATEKLRIDKAGNVGIGTTSPSATLHVSSGNSNVTPNVNADNLFIENNGAAGITIGSGANEKGNIYFGDAVDGKDGYIQYAHDTRYLRFATATSERMRIDSSGNVGIGTSSPSRKLHVVSGTGTAQIESTTTASILHFGDTNSTSIDAQGIGSIGTNIWVVTSGTEKMRIDSSGNVGIGTTSPSNVLHIKNSNPTIRLEDSDASSSIYGQIISNGAGDINLSADVGNAGSSTKITFSTDSSERMRINSSGNLLVGTTSSLELQAVLVLQELH